MAKAILMRMGNAREYLDYMIAAKVPFLLTTSNYSMKIEALNNTVLIDEEELYIKEELKLLDRKFVANEQSIRTFAAFAKIKSDLKDKPVPKIKPDELIYFQHDFKQNMYVEHVINVDLKSAYATILYNDGYISEETFRYLIRANKKERLASVGMLASRKRIFHFHKGEPIGQPEEIISPNAGFFFHAVKRTYEVMSELKRICGQSYLYTWVDGIYFLPDDPAIAWECSRYLHSVGLNFSVDQLTEFEVTIRDDTVNITFKKNGERKVFNLPSLSTEFKRIALDAILLINKKEKQNEQTNFHAHKGKKGGAKLFVR